MKEGTVQIGTNTGAVALGENASAVCALTAEVFQPGETVELRSGSPLMTVTEVAGGMVHCTWFRGKENNQGVFPAVTLLHKIPEWRRG